MRRHIFVLTGVGQLRDSGSMKREDALLRRPLRKSKHQASAQIASHEEIGLGRKNKTKGKHQNQQNTHKQKKHGTVRPFLQD